MLKKRLGVGLDGRFFYGLYCTILPRNGRCCSVIVPTGKPSMRAKNGDQVQPIAPEMAAAAP